MHNTVLSLASNIPKHQAATKSRHLAGDTLDCLEQDTNDAVNSIEPCRFHSSPSPVCTSSVLAREKMSALPLGTNALVLVRSELSIA